jgi:ABC-2 type transport system permease protein
MLLAILVSFAIRFLLNLVAFWLLDWRGLLALHGATSTVLAGLAIPIAFFPSWERFAVYRSLPDLVRVAVRATSSTSGTPQS